MTDTCTTADPYCMPDEDGYIHCPTCRLGEAGKWRERAIKFTGEVIGVADLSKQLGVRATRVLGWLWGMGMEHLSISSRIDYATAMVVADGIRAEAKDEKPAAAATKRHVVVIGGSRGIGRAVAKFYCNRGERVTVISRSLPGGFGYPARLHQNKECKCVWFKPDGEAAGWGEICVGIGSIGSIDLLVYTAAAAPTIGSLREQKLGDWLRPLQTDLVNAVKACKAALPRMKRGGKIILFSSLHGSQGTLPGRTAYATAKAAVEGFVRSLAVELAPDGIAVNAIAPGFVDGERLREAGAAVAGRPEYGFRVPAMPGALPTDADVAEFVALIAQASPFLTGQTLVFDGGHSLALA